MKNFKFGYYPGFNTEPLKIEDKRQLVEMYMNYMLCRTQQMFKWEGLPDTIPQRSLELYIQTNGNCVIAEVEGSLYAFVGGLGGEPDPYYMPTLYTVANPALNLSKAYKINEDCVVVPNDSLYFGLIPMFRKYATQLTENDISMNLVDINTRVQSLLAAQDDRTRASAEKYLKDVYDGKLGVIAETAFLDGIKVSPYANHNSDGLTNLIEYHQYLKAGWFNELGLNSNYNMKRESINSEEAQLNDDALLPLIDDMLLRRQEAAERINAMFGTNITVSLSSAWEDNAIELELEHQAIDEESSEDVDKETVDDVESSEALETDEEVEGTDDESEEIQEDKSEEPESTSDDEGEPDVSVEVNISLDKEDGEEDDEDEQDSTE